MTERSRPTSAPPPSPALSSAPHPSSAPRRSSAPLPTPDVIAADLRALGVRSGDLLMVHASLRSIGPVEGGAEGVLAALRLAVAADGTLVMPVGARDDWAWVNERPEPERAELLRDAPPFDARVTPADPEVGVLAEVFRQQPGTDVSDHPEGRFAAAGPLADDLLGDVPWDDYLGAGSPLERFCDGGGRVLRLGADMDTMTILHYAENLVDIDGKRRTRRLRRVSGPAGPSLRWVEALDDVHGIVDYAGGDYFSDDLRAYLATGRAAQGLVGTATAELIDAADFVTFSVDWLARHLAQR